MQPDGTGLGLEEEAELSSDNLCQEVSPVDQNRTKACNPSEEPVLKGSFERVSTGSSTSIEEIDMICFMSISAM